MVHLNQAARELFRRKPDERFESLESLTVHCNKRRAYAEELWRTPRKMSAVVEGDELLLVSDDHEREVFKPNDWSFGQLCRMAGVAKETVNRLSPETAGRVFGETLPRSDRPLQVYMEPAVPFEQHATLRSLHMASYTRLFNAEVLEVVNEFQGDFKPPHVGMNGGTGLYCVEQDMFCFLIDPDGWIDIEGEAFAPGFFVWNSEVGCRSVGMMTFWFQKVCGNHIVWDVTNVDRFSRKHTANVHEALGEIRGMIEGLVAKRDERKDAFSRMIADSMGTKLGNDAEEAVDALAKHGLSRKLAGEVVTVAQQRGPLTVFSVVDALTRRSQQLTFAAARANADQQAARLLSLAV